MKCILCGKEAKYESMSLASPVCEDCAKQMAEMYARNRELSVEEALEEIYVPAAGDITKLRQE